MKKKILFCFVMIFILTMILPVCLPCQEEDEEEGEPVQARPDPRAWTRLKKMDMLRTIRIKMIQNGQAREFDLRNVRQALEKAGIRQKVTIEYVGPEGNVFPLGTYTPAFSKSRGVKKQINRKLINPQPEPPRFHNIPLLRQVPVSAALKKPTVHGKGQSLLVFKDGNGQTKAVVKLQMPLQMKTMPFKTKRK